jgi:ribosome-interacting GTPase 1
MLLENIEQYLEEAKIKNAKITTAEDVSTSKQNIEDLHNQIDRLNYSWQTGKIRKVEQYEKQYAELMAKLDEAEAAQPYIEEKDFTKIEGILRTGWKGIYEALDDEHKRAFWRSFVSAIEIDWTTEKKEITGVSFF